MTTHCPDCGEERLFETPPCSEGHAECPERVCTGCGYAVVVGWLGVDVAGRAGAPVTAAA